MKNRLKALPMLQGKKRYIAFALLLVELMTLPATAQIVQKVSFEARPMVTAVKIPTVEPGVSRYLVASNAGFVLEANNIIGDITVDVHQSGILSEGNNFGASAQLPGPKLSCRQTNGLSSIIYKANQKTSAIPGTPPEQAVMFEIQYSTDSRPEFKFIAGEATTPEASSCNRANS